MLISIQYNGDSWLYVYILLPHSSQQSDMTPIDTIASLTLDILEARGTKRPKTPKDNGEPYKCEPRPTTIIYLGTSHILSAFCGLYLTLISVIHHYQLCCVVCLAYTSAENEVGGFTT